LVVRQVLHEESGDGSTHRTLRVHDLETDPPTFRLSIDSEDLAAQSIVITPAVALRIAIAAGSNPATSTNPPPEAP
jgi:hypothetical protein